jgi:hypothetical protein
MTMQFDVQMPAYSAGFGIRTPFGVSLPPGSNVAAFVRSTGAQSQDDPIVSSNLVKDTPSALLRCRSGMGDYVVYLPGHTESVVDNTFLDNMVAGTRLMGTGYGSAMPTFTWTAAASQMRLNKADVQLIGLRLNLGGFNGVTNAIAWTAADNLMTACDVIMCSSATLKAVIGITVSGTPDRGRISCTRFRGNTGSVTDGILISGTPDEFSMFDCRMNFPGTTTNGLIRITGAATNIDFSKLRLRNATAASTTTISIADVASSGDIQEVNSDDQNNGTAASQGIIFAAVTTTTIKCFSCLESNEPGKSGIISPAAST